MFGNNVNDLIGVARDSDRKHIAMLVNDLIQRMHVDRMTKRRAIALVREFAELARLEVDP